MCDLRHGLLIFIRNAAFFLAIDCLGLRLHSHLPSRTRHSSLRSTTIMSEVWTTIILYSQFSHVPYLSWHCHAWPQLSKFSSIVRSFLVLSHSTIFTETSVIKPQDSHILSLNAILYEMSRVRKAVNRHNWKSPNFMDSIKCRQEVEPLQHWHTDSLHQAGNLFKKWITLHTVTSI